MLLAWALICGWAIATALGGGATSPLFVFEAPAAGLLLWECERRRLGPFAVTGALAALSAAEGVLAVGAVWLLGATAG
jgi:hypothetical protein